MSEERKKEVLLNALMVHLRNCERLARKYPDCPAYKKDADDVAELIKEILDGWRD